MTNYSDVTGGIIFIAMGIFFIIFHRVIGGKTAEYINKQTKLLRWGLTSSSFINRLSFVVIGIAFIVFGFKLLI